MENLILINYKFLILNNFWK